MQATGHDDQARPMSWGMLVYRFILVGLQVLALGFGFSVLLVMVRFANPPSLSGFYNAVLSFQAGLLLPIVPMLASPRWRWAVVAGVLFCVVLPVSIFLGQIESASPRPMSWVITPSVVSVGAAAIVWLVGWLIYTRSIRPRWVMQTSLLVGLVAVVGYYSVTVQMYRAAVGEKTTELPEHFKKLMFEDLEDAGLAQVKFYTFELGLQFVEHDRLWRVDAPPDVLERMIHYMWSMQPTDKAPDKFWRMPPSYWPRSMPAGGKLYKSAQFDLSGYQRHPGQHVFLLHDTAKSRVYAWEDEFY